MWVWPKASACQYQSTCASWQKPVGPVQIILWHLDANRKWVCKPPRNGRKQRVYRIAGNKN